MRGRKEALDAWTALGLRATPSSESPNLSLTLKRSRWEGECWQAAISLSTGTPPPRADCLRKEE